MVSEGLNLGMSIGVSMGIISGAFPGFTTRLSLEQGFRIQGLGLRVEGI